MVDDWLIDALDGAELRLHHPVAQEVALPFDAPWEGPVSFYVTMLEYQGEYRAYYRGQKDERSGDVVAVATSGDGITWQRPNLGLFAWNGSRANNITWNGVGSHAFAPFVDSNPAASSSQRFKAVAPLRGGRRGLVPFVSEDGYRWRQWQEEPVITDGAFDSQNLAFWDAYRGQYVSFFRDFRDGVRSIKWCTSEDFIHWTQPHWLDFGDTPLEHFYTNATISYFRAPHMYLAFPKRFVPERKVVPEHPGPGVSDGVLMSSRDGLHWDRPFMEAFLRPGLDRRNWTERNNAIAWGILHTAPAELSLYWVENYRHPTCRLRRGTLRLDGFASVNAGYEGGEMRTHPLVFEGRELVLNYATSAAGSVRVELQGADGRPLAGYTLEDSVELYGDDVEQPVSWKGSSSVAYLAGQPIRLRIVLHDADLYALRFRP
jgi:hypothetical protein